MKRLAVAALLVSLAFTAHARRVERVAFPSFDHDVRGASVIVHAILLLPQGNPPKGGWPAIVALHSCGGMYSTREGREQALSSRFALRASPLLRDGYAVLFVDSYRSRGLSQICTIQYGARTVKIAQRRLDALAALAYLQRRRDIAQNRIALVGWSHGGSTALATIGERDDWTPAATCVALGNAMALRNADLRVTTFPDSYHAFDSPTGRLVHRTDVPNGVHPGSGVHVGPNPAAREAAVASMRAFLRERLGQ